MFIIIKWQNRQLGVPLEQILPIDSDEETIEAVKDWHYWVVKRISILTVQMTRITNRQTCSTTSLNT
jgi:hypothetical protein